MHVYPGAPGDNDAFISIDIENSVFVDNVADGLFDGGSEGPWLHDVVWSAPGVTPLAATPMARLGELLEQLVAEFDSAEAGRHSMLELLVHAILVLLARCVLEEEKSETTAEQETRLTMFQRSRDRMFMLTLPLLIARPSAISLRERGRGER